MNGIELQRRLLADNSRIPVVFISGRANASLRDFAMRAGAIDFLSKPVRSDTLLKAIRSALTSGPDRDR
jgi:FixJ family two-component response regulator